MTENEAIGVLKYLNFCGLCTTGPCGNCERKQAKDAALSALEEIQQYRAIGTVEEINQMKRYFQLAKKHGTIGKVIDACAEYEQIGTPRSTPHRHGQADSRHPAGRQGLLYMPQVRSAQEHSQQTGILWELWTEDDVGVDSEQDQWEV